MELLFSLVIIHGQMFRLFLLFFFLLFFCFLHFFLFMAPCNTLHSNLMDLNELQPVSWKHNSLSKFFHRENCLSVSDWFKMTVALQ